MRRWFTVASVLLALGFLSLFVSCTSRQESKNIAREESHIKSLAVLYGRFTGSHRGQMPPNEAVFKKFVQSSRQGDSEGVGWDALFVSDRDEKPYVILYGNQVRGAPANGPGGAPVVIYEQDGVDGMRYVASSMGAVEEVDEEQFQQLVPRGGT